MKEKTKHFNNLILFSLFMAAALIGGACSSNKPFDGGVEPLVVTTTTMAPAVEVSYGGYFVVTSVATDPTTGPGLVTMFKPSGAFHASLRDLYPSIEWAMGSVFVEPDRILVGIGNGTRIESLNLTTQINSNFATARINGVPNRALARDISDGAVYLGEHNAATSTIEKYDSTGNPIGAPFINSTVGACVLNNPTGIAYIKTTQNIAVIQSTRLNIYDKTGACVSSVTVAPFATNAPYAIVYHSQTNKLLVAFATNHSIQACSTLGTGCAQIYLNASIVNTPRSIAVDSSGFIYIGSSGTDTVEKFSWSGVGSAVRVGTASFMGPGIYTQNPTSITVME